MKHTEAKNPVAERAAIRRQTWEANTGFWTRPRYDNFDMLILIGGTVCAMIGIFGLISLMG